MPFGLSVKKHFYHQNNNIECRSNPNSAIAVLGGSRGSKN